MFKEILTNPEEHNPNNFIYLVHGFLDWDSTGITPKEMMEKTKRILDPEQFYRASLVGKLEKDAAIQKFSYHREIAQLGTFGEIGLILNPSSNSLVQIAWNCDLGSPWDPEEFKKFVTKHNGKIRGPVILLTQTKGQEDLKCNELIIQGDKNTIIEGVFYNKDWGEKQKAQTLAEIISEITEKRVPIIELPSPKKEDSGNHDKDDRKRLVKLDCLRAQCEIMEAQVEFNSPWLRSEREFQKDYHFGIKQIEYKLPEELKKLVIKVKGDL